MIKNQMEIEEENIVNRLQRQIETLVANYKALEVALAARGINIKDLTGPLSVDRATEWVYGRSPSKGSSDLRRSSDFVSACCPCPAAVGRPAREQGTSST